MHRKAAFGLMLMLLFAGMLTVVLHPIYACVHTSLFSFAYGFTSLEVDEPEEAPCEKQFLTTPFSAGSFTQLSEPPPTEWNQTYGGAWDDAAYSVVQTEDGGYALAGYTRSFSAGHYDCWLVKTDAAGNEQWNQTYSGMNDGWAWSVVQTEDGGYALAGPIWPLGSDKSDFWLVKTDSNGNTQWDQTYGGNEVDYACSAVETSDGGYAIAGETASFGAGNSDCWLVKTDSAGNMEWNQTYGGTSGEGGQSIVQTSDGGYAIAGTGGSFDIDGDFWLVKTDADGNEQWNQTYSAIYWERAYSLVQTSDGGYAIAGETKSFGAGSADFWLVKTDANGNMEWNQTYGGTDYDSAWSVVETRDGGYALAGYTISFGVGYVDCWLVKTDAAGYALWNQTYGGTNLQSGALSVVETSDGGYAIAGFTNSFDAVDADFYLVKTAGRMLEETRVFFNVDPNPATVGDTLRLKGVLLDESSQPLASEMVRLYARPLAGSWRYITAFSTNGYGIFTWQVTIPEVPAGAYVFAVYYPGSESYESCYNFAILIIQ